MSDSSREDLFPRVSASGGWPLPYEEMEGASTSQTDKPLHIDLHIDYDFEELRILEEDQQALIDDELDQDHFEELRQHEEDLQAAIDEHEEQSSL